MTVLMTEVATRVFNTPLMMHEGKAIAALSAIGGRIVDGGVEFAGGIEPIYHVAFENGRPSAGRLSNRVGAAYEAAGRRPYDMHENVAVIPIEGTLVHKGAYVGASSGRTSYQGLQAQIRAAANDPKVKGVVFEVDSFGGEVAGAFETADMIHALSAMKPTLSILTDHAASAGYLLASASRQIIMPEHGMAGSIGVITMHADYSGALEKQGVKVTVLSAGKHKAEGSPYAALPEDVANRMLSGLNAARESFAAAVGKYRGKRFSASAAMATEAATYRGSEAVAIGMADATSHAIPALDAFVVNVNRRGPSFV